MRILLTFLFSLTVAMGFAQVKPNNFFEETDPDNSNFEFYSQKNNSSRRATFNNVKKGMVPFVTDTVNFIPAASGNTTNLGEFVWDTTGMLWYIDGQGIGIAIPSGSGGPIYVTSDSSAQITVYAPAHGLTDTIALYGYVPVKSDFTRANSLSVDSSFIAYAIDAPDVDSLTLMFSGLLIYGSWHGKELNTQYYLQDDGSEATSAGTINIPTAIASDSTTLLLREVGTDIAGRLRRVAIPSPAITAFGGDPSNPTDAVVQALIAGLYLPAGVAQPGTLFTLSYLTQSHNPTYQQNSPNSNPLTPSYSWLWDGSYATRISNIPVSVDLQDTLYGTLGTLTLVSIDDIMVGAYPTDDEVAIWADSNYTNHGLRLANGSLLYFVGDSTEQNPQYMWQIIDDVSYTGAATEWERIVKRIKSPGGGAADGNGIYSASGVVALEVDALARVRQDTTFSLAECNGCTGFEDYYDNATTDWEFKGLALSTLFDGSISLSWREFNDTTINNLYLTNDEAGIYARSGSTSNSYSAYITATNDKPALASERGKIKMGGSTNGSGYSYTMPYSSPSATSADTSIMVWAGNGTGADPLFVDKTDFSDGNGIFDASNNGDTVRISSAILKADLALNGGYATTIQGNINSVSKLNVYNIGTNSSGIYAYATTAPIAASAITYPAGLFTSTNGVGIDVQTVSTDTTGILYGVSMQNASTGVGGVGFGTGLKFNLETSSGVYESNTIESRWTNALAVSHTSALDFYGKNGAARERLMSIAGSGQLTLDGYAHAAMNQPDSIAYVLGTSATGSQIWQIPVGGVADGNGLFSASNDAGKFGVTTAYTSDGGLWLIDSSGTFVGFDLYPSGGGDNYCYLQPNDFQVMVDPISAGTGWAYLELDTTNMTLQMGTATKHRNEVNLGINNFIVSQDTTGISNQIVNVAFSGYVNGGMDAANITLFEKYNLANATPSATSADTSIMVWAGNGTGADPLFIDKTEFGSTTLETSNDSINIQGGTAVRMSGTGFIRDSVTTTTLTVDLASRNTAVVVLKMESATNVTLTINNPWSSVSGSYPDQSGETGVYTFVFRGISGTDNVTWPATFYDMGGTALGTDALTAGTAYTCFYDPVEAKYYCK